MKKKLAAAVEMGRLGGKARAQKLTKARRKEIARRGGKARWAQKKENPSLDFKSRVAGEQ